jgi:V/A-type H+-transporting ATPase subunit I
MYRVAVIGLRSSRHRVLSVLHDMGVVQIEPLSKEALSFVGGQVDDLFAREVSDELLRIRSLKSALPETPVTERRAFGSLGELLQVSRSISIDSEVSSLKTKQENLASEIERITDLARLVEKLSFVDRDLSIFDLRSAASFYCELDAEVTPRFRESLLMSIPEAMLISSTLGEKEKLAIVVPNEKLDAFGTEIQKFDLKMQRIPRLNGRPGELSAQLRKESEQKLEELQKVLKRLEEISSRYYSLLSSVEEQLTIEAKKSEVVNSLGFTEQTFFLEGWVPARRLDSLSRALKRYTGESTQVMRIPSSERPPTLLQNPSRLRYFESFIRFYSLPQQNEFDPTLIFAFTFPIFFGLMLGDVGYGMVILGISFWIIRRVHHPGRTVVPAKLRAFARNIFRPSAFEKLAMAMIPGATIGVVLGFLFNEYFGFHLNQYLFAYLNSLANLGLPSSGAFLDPISGVGLKRLLLISGYIGLFEVSFGLLLGFLNGILTREVRHALGKLGWLFIAWSVALLGLTIIHGGSLVPTSNLFSGLYMATLLAGLGLVVFGEGGQAIIELPSIVSHIISYTRLVGILLASVVLAEVIDQVFLGTLAGGVALVIAGLVVLVFGQLFNLILALFEPGIQGARLIYVEFFSKFFHGSGRPFFPFGGQRRYTMQEIETIEPSRE